VQRELSDDEALCWRDGGEGELGLQIAESDVSGGEFVAVGADEGGSAFGGGNATLGGTGHTWAQ
jgi:hypothetical protein